MSYRSNPNEHPNGLLMRLSGSSLRDQTEGIDSWVPLRDPNGPFKNLTEKSERAPLISKPRSYPRRASQSQPNGPLPGGDSQ
ncbi:hypothetical protein PssvBMR1_gp49 [Pseudomonas phage MR1]|uniref:Uncharacterized protein n=1 Tax=Pseudomonas phage MR1 TaxID=2711169 RepID=A0A6M3TC76_9CAUD|nr:hypothetical protein PssvBMR1_gp49 [Pseudomonas phage MR1]